MTSGILLLLFLTNACTHKVQLERDQYRLQKLTLKGNEQISTEELESVIPVNQKPNRKLIGFIPVHAGVGWYNLGKSKWFYDEERYKQQLKKWQIKLQALPTNDNGPISAKIARQTARFQRKINHKQEVLDTKENAFMKNVGEAPAVISETSMARTAKRIQKYLRDKGFIDNLVSYQIDSAGGNRKIKLTYLINEKNLYKLDTVSYQIEDKKIDSLLKTSAAKMLLKKGEALDENLIKTERIRIELFLKENGYYTFSEKNYIRISEIDTTDIVKRNFRVNLKLNINNPQNKPNHDQYRIKSVNFVAADASETLIGDKSDTTQTSLNGINYTFIGKRYPTKLLDKQILVRPDELFKLSSDNETKRQLYRLDQFMFANTVYTQLPDNQLRVDILAPSNFKFGTVLEPTLNNISSIFGGGVNASIRARNSLNSLDIFELGGRFALENQPSILDKNGPQYSREISLNFSVNLPKILLSEKISNKLSLKNPKTQLVLGFNNSSLATFRRQIFRLGGNYSWLKSRYETILLTPFDINFTRTPYKSKEFIEAIKNEPTLISTFGSQVVTSMSGSYVFNNQVLGQNVKARYLQVFGELGGSFMNLLKNKDNLGFVNRLFPNDTLAYFRYWKISADLRKYYPINRKSSWAYRLSMGVAQPYGKNQAMPYERNFFIGGQNSIRAWSPRSLGPGSSPLDVITTNDSTKRFRQQPGDIILEGSIEGRWYFARFFGDIYFAAFLDAGNVWKWYEVNSKPNQANFSFDKFTNEFAVGTGAGLRYDFQYFIMRFDWGIKVFDPSQSKGNRFVLDDFRFRKRFSDDTTNPYRLQFQFGVGHPF